MPPDTTPAQTRSRLKKWGDDRAEKNLPGVRFELVYANDDTKYTVGTNSSRKQRYEVARRIYRGQPTVRAALRVRASNATIPNRSGKSPITFYSPNKTVQAIIADTTKRLWLDDRLSHIMTAIHMFGEKFYAVDWARRLISAVIPIRKPEQVVGKVYDDKTGSLTGYLVTPSEHGYGEQVFYPWFEFEHFTDDPEEPFGEGLLSWLDHSEVDYRYARAAATLGRIQRSEDRWVIPVDISDAPTAEERQKLFVQALADRMRRRIIDSNGRFLPNNFPLESTGDIAAGINTKNGQFEAKVNKIKGQESLADIADIEFLLDEMLSVIGVPKKYLALGKDTTGKATLDRQDIQMLRLCIADQRHLIRGLRSLYDMQLASLGINPHDPANAYTVGIVDLSLDDERLHWTIEKIKTLIISEMIPWGVFDEVELVKKIYGWDDSEIKSLLRKSPAVRTPAQNAQVERSFAFLQDPRAKELVADMCGVFLDQAAEKAVSIAGLLAQRPPKML